MTSEDETHAREMGQISATLVEHGNVLKRQDDTLAEILRQTRATNGRLGVAETSIAVVQRDQEESGRDRDRLARSLADLSEQTRSGFDAISRRDLNRVKVEDEKTEERSLESGRMRREVLLGFLAAIAVFLSPIIAHAV